MADKLPDFIADARIDAGYESASHPLKFGKIMILGPYCKNGLCYLDICEGFEEFEGKTFVTRSNALVWQAEYSGRMLEPESSELAEKVYNEVLKPALRQFPKDAPWKRGPDKLEIGEYEYYNQCEGDLTASRNWEKIIHAPTQKEIYSYSDKGKLVNLS